MSENQQSLLPDLYYVRRRLMADVTGFGEYF